MEKYMEASTLDSLQEVRNSYWKFLNYIEEVGPILYEHQVQNGINHHDPLIRLGFVETENLYLSKEQVDALLNDTEWRIRCAVINRRDIYLTEDQIKVAFNDPSWNVRIAAFQTYKSFLTEEIRNLGLCDESPEIRAFFFSLSSSYLPRLNNENISIGLNDDSLLVRASAAKYHEGGIGISLKNTDKALTDDGVVVCNMIRNPSVDMRGRHIDLCLKHKDRLVRAAITEFLYSSSKEHYIKELYTPAMIESFAKDDEWRVRRSFSKFRGLTNSQIDLFLSDKEPVVRTAFSRSPCILTWEQEKRGLEDNDINVKLAFLRRNIMGSILDKAAYTLSESEIESFLTHPNPFVRKALTYKYDVNNNLFFTRNQLDRGLADKDEMVRLCFFKIIGSQLTKEQIELGLIDEHHVIRSYCATIGSNGLTQEQIKRGLKDICPAVRNSFISLDNIRLDVDQVDTYLSYPDPFFRARVYSFKDILFTKEQLKKGMSDDFNVVKAIIDNESIKLSKEQIEDALANEHPLVRCSIVNRKDITLTPKQIDRGLNDIDITVRRAFYMCDRIELNDEQKSRLIDDVYLSCEDKSHIIALPNTELNRKQVENLLLDRSSLVVISLAKNRNYIPSQEEIDILLSHKDFRVAVAIINRDDIKLTQKQIKECLLSKSYCVQEAIFRRKDFNLVFTKESMENDRSHTRTVGRSCKVVKR